MFLRGGGKPHKNIVYNICYFLYMCILYIFTHTFYKNEICPIDVCMLCRLAICYHKRNSVFTEIFAWKNNHFVRIYRRNIFLDPRLCLKLKSTNYILSSVIHPVLVVWPTFGHHALTSSFTKYKFLQMKNNFETIVTGR